MSTQNFADLGVSKVVVDALAARGITTPFAIQSLVVPDVLEGHDVLVTPAVHGEAPAGLGATGDPLFSRAFTLLGLPTLTLPAFRGPAGLPIGIQLVAARGDDAALLQAGAAIEAALSWRSDETRPDASMWRAP